MNVKYKPILYCYGCGKDVRPCIMKSGKLYTSITQLKDNNPLLNWKVCITEEWEHKRSEN